MAGKHRRSLSAAAGDLPHTAGSYQSEVARVEIWPDGSRTVHVHFVNTVVLPLYEVPSDIGILATLLRLALRFRYEVIDKYHRSVESASSVNYAADGERNLLTQLRASIATIECDAQSRGTEYHARGSRHFVRLAPRSETNTRPFYRLGPGPRTTVQRCTQADAARAVELLDHMHTANRRFMSLATRQLPEIGRSLIWAGSRLTCEVHQQGNTQRKAAQRVASGAGYCRVLSASPASLIGHRYGRASSDFSNSRCCSWQLTQGPRGRRAAPPVPTL